jgi:lipopolysaccharide export system protein LptA
MRFRRGSKYPFWLEAAIILLFLAAVALFFLHQGRGSSAPKTVNTEVDGLNLTYFDFDQKNQKKMEVRCRESQPYGPNRLRMKEITATIFKTGTLDQEIKVTAESGIVSSNFYDFEIRDRARIFSSDFSLSSQSFNLQHRAMLSSRDAVDFKLKDVSGRAAAGMEYYLNLSVLKLFQCRGTMVRDGQPYDFQAKTFWVIKKDNLILLEKNSELTGSGTTLRGDWISMKFDRDFVKLRSVSNHGHCFFSMVQNGENGRSQSKEINANSIFIDYDEEGRLQHIVVEGAGRITLQEGKSQGRIESEKTEIFLRPETQTVEKVRVSTRGTLTSHGTDPITVSGDALGARYAADGSLSRVEAKSNCEFSTEDLHGTAEAITYDAPRFLIDINGKDAAIISKKNVFHSSHFQVHTRQRQLSSLQAVQATIVPENKNVLFSSKPLFITAAAMEMTDRGNIIRFREKVKLFQDDIELHAGEMLFDGRKNHMSFSGGADMKFINENELLILRGQSMAFEPSGQRIVITGNANLNQGENVLSGRQIELLFQGADRLENILARDNVTFSKKELSGKSGLLHWDFNKKTILFKNSAQISRKNTGTTKGRELLLNLSSNEINVTSQEDRAETTISQGRP